MEEGAWRELGQEREPCKGVLLQPCCSPSSRAAIVMLAPATRGAAYLLQIHGLQYYCVHSVMYGTIIGHART